MTPAEKLIAIVERAKPGCPIDFDRVWGNLAPMRVLTLRAENAEWQAARDLLERLLASDTAPHQWSWLCKCTACLESQKAATEAGASR